MKILIANKFYHERGGDCIYTLQLENLLAYFGHKVAVFSMKHPNNLPNTWNRYWPSNVEFSDKNVNKILKMLFRPLYDREVERKFKQLLIDFKPEIVHLGNIHSQLSPIIAKIAYENSIPVVWTLHDYKLLCPSYTCLRNNTFCKKCFKNKKNVVRYKCIKNSFIASLIGYLEAIIWNRVKLEKYVSNFICPSKFIMQKMVEGRFDASKMIVINNFLFLYERKIDYHENKKNYYCYYGRLSLEKGVETLLKAASMLPEYHLKIIGTGPLEKYLRDKYRQAHITFFGYLQSDELRVIIKNAKFTVVPSECYENNPYSIIESFALGTPVLGARIGGIPELIKIGYNGYLFETRNILDLKEKIIEMFHEDLNEMSYNCLKFTSNYFDANTYYNKLIKIYKNLLPRLDS